MKYLLDTCVVSELTKRTPDAKVVSWLQQQNEADLYLSVLTFAEIEKGIAKTPDQVHKQKLRVWLDEDLRQRFDGRIIPFDLEAAIKWGAVQGVLEKQGNMMPVFDSLIAISALVHGLTVVTRNTSDMVNSSVGLLDPWV